MKNLIIYLLITLLATAQVCYSQSFYDINTIQKIEITFEQSNWDYMLDTAKAGSEGYIMAKSVTINGLLFDSVGVKYKGNSTYRSTQLKNPFHIELDTYKNQDYQGYTDIKLSNAAKDPSMLREVLSYSILRQYMNAPQSNYANVYVNGTLIGLYVSSESIGKRFVNEHFGSKNNSFFKCNPIAGAGPGTTSLPNLVYLGTDSSKYYPSYEMNSNFGWKDLIELCNSLKNNINSIESVLYVDKALWMLAFDNVLVNLDSYIGGFAQNYYLYKDDNGRFNSVVWDLNESLGTFSQTGTISLTNTSTKSQMTHLLHSTDANWPLVQMLLSVPTYKKMYLAHIQTILSENFANNSYLTTAQTLQTIINSAVQADPNKFFTYAQYQSNLTSDVSSGTGPGSSSAPGISALMSARNSYLSKLSDFTTLQPTITNVAPTVEKPAYNSTAIITANISNSNSVQLGYRFEITDKFTKVIMYDDGAHSDNAAGDKIFACSIPMNNAVIQYFIYAENSTSGRFSPERAEHEFYTLNASIPNILAGSVVINEFMAQNTASQTDSNGEYEDWIELYNTTSTSIILDNLYLSDTPANLLKWKFPNGTTIAPNGYLIVWADEDGSQSGLHANFKLSANGEYVILSNADATMVDNIVFGAQTANIAYARNPNGTGWFEFKTHTFNSNNDLPLWIENQSISNMRFELFQNYPNPFASETAIVYQIADSENITLKIFDVFGREVATLVEQNQTSGTYTVLVDAQKFALTNGTYFYRLNVGNETKFGKMSLIR